MPGRTARNLAAFAAIALGCAGCSALFHELGGEATRGALEQDRALIALLENPRLREATAGLLSSSLTTTLQVLQANRPALDAELDHLAQALFDSANRAAGGSLGEDLRGELRQGLQDAVDQLLAEPNVERMEDLGQRLTVRLVDTAIRTTSAGIRRELGDDAAQRVGAALAAVLEEQLAPALGRSLAQGQDQLGSTAHVLSRELAGGLGEALVAGGPLDLALAAQRKTLFAELHDFLEQERKAGEGFLKSVRDVVAALAALVAGILALLLRRKQKASSLSEQTIMTIAHAIKNVEETDVGQSLLGQVKAAVKDNPALEDHLEGMLRKQPMLRAHVKKDEPA